MLSASLPPGVEVHIEKKRGASREESLLAYTLLSHLFRETGLPLSSVAFSERGAPQVIASPGTSLYISIAHTDNLVAAALSDHPVGIDIEELSPRKNAKALAQRWLHAADVAAVASAEEEEQTPLFLSLWTKHEATAKREGTGIAARRGAALPPPDRFPASGIGEVAGIRYAYALSV